MYIFIDNVCPSPYSSSDLLTKGLGGSEATMVRVVERLNKLGHKALVEQTRRESDEGYYIKAKSYIGTDIVKAAVSYRDPRPLKAMKERFPHAKLFLWCQDLISPQYAEYVPWMIENNVTLICLSGFHRSQAIQALRLLDYREALQIRVVPNPIEDDLRNPEKEEVDYNKMVWLSAPMKGWKEGRECFEKLYSTHPEFRLHVFHPEYDSTALGPDHPGIVKRGPVPPSQLIDEVSTSLCLFYPNVSFPETFGIVFAECDALGTPVLAHQFGASSEVTDHMSETMDCSNHEAVIKRVLAWQSGERPVVEARNEYRLKNVVKEWIRHLK